MLKPNVSQRLSTAGKGGAAAVLAVGLFASWPYTNEARAIDSAPNASNATLAFSPTTVSPQQFLRVCAVNYNTMPVNLLFVLTDATNEPFQPGTLFFDGEGGPIAPGNRSCSPTFGAGNLPFDVLAKIVLESPTDCSQATDYPGKCRVLASVEISGIAEGGMYEHRIHLEPSLLTAIPAPPRINPVPLPQ
jgi:hypothetical protein